MRPLATHSAAIRDPPPFLIVIIIIACDVLKSPQLKLHSRDRIVVSTLRCGRNNPGSNPGHGISLSKKKMDEKKCDSR